MGQADQAVTGLPFGSGAHAHTFGERAYYRLHNHEGSASEKKVAVACSMCIPDKHDASHTAWSLCG